ncbi:MAG: hypothetical protein P4M11_01810 [Candidatus Pacebacteria bacterium]|nr:hypothetical protein [Candidatus Paceibacterota bacterium]
MGQTDSKKKSACLSPAGKPGSDLRRVDLASDETSVEEEWTELVENFLEEHTKSCFWAQPLLTYRHAFCDMR